MTHPQSTRQCPKCQQLLPLVSFEPRLDRHGRKNGFFLRCRSCRQQIHETAPTKQCLNCQRVLPYDAFERRETAEGDRMYLRCRECRADRWDIARRLWAQVEKTDGCWLFRGSLTRAGYGRLNNQHQTGRRTYVLAHRLSYTLTYGEIASSVFICHKCDTPACVRPDHLFAGTPADNMQDMKSKGRARPRRGADHPTTRLTENDVREIRAQAAQGANQHVLAAQYGMDQSSISNIVTRKHWKHLP